MAPEAPYNRVDTLEHFAEEISTAGLWIEVAKECPVPERFHDVGAVVYFRRAAPWEIPGFTTERYRPVPESIHAEIERRGFWKLGAQRLLVVAGEKPG